MRPCNTCQHLKRPDIDRRLAAGEPVAVVAHAYGLSVSSVHRHRVNCLHLASSNEIKKEAARGSAAVALLPSKENLSKGYADLQVRIDGIVVGHKRTLWSRYIPSRSLTLAPVNRTSCVIGLDNPVYQVGEAATKLSIKNIFDAICNFVMRLRIKLASKDFPFVCF
jgi:hypothetical protein